MLNSHEFLSVMQPFNIRTYINNYTDFFLVVVINMPLFLVSTASLYVPLGVFAQSHSSLRNVAVFIFFHKKWEGYSSYIVVSEITKLEY